MGTEIHVTIVFDFMCPWSFIGMRSLELAVKNMVSRQDKGDRPVAFFFKLLPLESRPPGTYPAGGSDWAEHCQAVGPKAVQLLHEELPRIIALGAKIDITFRQERRIVHTEAVNAALMLAQRFGRGLEFALAMLGYHFEHLRDPNSPQLISQVLVQGFQLPEAAVAEVLAESKARAALGDELRELSRKLGASGVPKFRVSCNGSSDLCPAGGDEGPTSPEYFERIFEACLCRAPTAAPSAVATLSESDSASKSDLPELLRPMVESLRTVLSGYAQSGSLNLPEGVSVLRDGSRDTGVRLNDLD
ncbi:unnamed protein product [Polarella glacialis]|uniref:DSBA-like thioredoxin domain-containing protein n=1 Tax=Polarella glacialis TaxID=89957 RepID=A0A813JXJ2_POLGL|nr:unnamed protein product [Polarella glacialis]